MYCICIYSIILKALWGGHTAALQIMLGKELQAGERKHAVRSRRLHEDDIMTACTAKSSPEMVLICLNAGLRRHVLHELAPFAAVKVMLPTEGGEGVLVDKMMAKTMRKCVNATLDACD